MVVAAKCWKQLSCPLVGFGSSKLWCDYAIEYCATIKENEREIFIYNILQNTVSDKTQNSGHRKKKKRKKQY